jgi:outer membrane protein assembly factor BamD (BamD/ComL family)
VLLRQAQQELRGGHPGRALGPLSEHTRRFPRGALAEEREALRAVALCHTELGPGARAMARSFLRSWPDSPLGDRVRAACVVH